MGQGDVRPVFDEKKGNGGELGGEQFKNRKGSSVARGGRGSEKSDPGRIGSKIFMTRPGLNRVKKTVQTYFI